MAVLIDETDLAAATIIGEAEGEGFDGQIAVAKVIRNRIRQRFFSDGTLAGTVLAPYQFSLWNTNERRRIAVCNMDWASLMVQQCRRAWVESEDWKGLPNDVVMYHASTMDPFPRWATVQPAQFTQVAKIGRHIFYKKVK